MTPANKIMTEEERYEIRSEMSKLIPQIQQKLVDRYKGIAQNIYIAVADEETRKFYADIEYDYNEGGKKQHCRHRGIFSEKELDYFIPGIAG